MSWPGPAGVGIVFAPSVGEMYPGGAPETRVVPGPLADRLEGASRPGHFAGVATVVTKLLSLCGHCRAYFGEKDFQQLAVVRNLVHDLDLDAEIVACPTVREPDGLACSSRNRRLGPDDRRAATVLFKALEAGRARVASGEREGAQVEKTMAAVVAAEPRAKLDYAVVVDPVTFAVPACARRRATPPHRGGCGSGPPDRQPGSAGMTARSAPLCSRRVRRVTT